MIAAKKSLVGYAFISPWLLGFLAFTVYPFLSSAYLSFTRYDIVTKPVWVGAANYRTLLTGDALFWKSLGALRGINRKTKGIGCIVFVGCLVPVSPRHCFISLGFQPVALDLKLPCKILKQLASRSS